MASRTDNGHFPRDQALTMAKNKRYTPPSARESTETRDAPRTPGLGPSQRVERAQQQGNGGRLHANTQYSQQGGRGGAQHLRGGAHFQDPASHQPFGGPVKYQAHGYCGHGGPRQRGTPQPYHDGRRSGSHGRGLPATSITLPELHQAPPSRFATCCSEGRLVDLRYASRVATRFSTQRAQFATAATAANVKPQVPTSVSPRVATRNVLKSTIGLIPRTLPLGQQSLWERRAQDALNELETGRTRPLRVAVWGDELSGASEVVTGLLDDPLSDDAIQRNMLRQRWDSTSRNRVIRIRKDNTASWNGQVLSIKSNWLQNINGEIIECRDRDAFDTLLSCDHIILVTDNIRGLSAPGLQEALRDLTRAPSVSLIVTERASGVPTLVNGFGNIKTTFIKPDLAIRGLDAFTQGNVNQYQTLLMASGLPNFSQAISSLYMESNQPSSPSSTASRAAVRTSAHIARVAFSACEEAVDDAQKSITNTLTPLGPLKAEVSSIGLDALHSTLRGSTTVREGIASVETRIRATFRRLPWYSLWWRADEVSSALSGSISWTPLDTQLSFHSGRLANIREQMHQKAVALAAVSPLLNNRLAQIHARTAIDPDALSSPVFQRTTQLFAPGGPVEDVQRKAQTAVMATAANILGSGALSTGLFAIGSISGGTAIGAGLLGSVASVRWMQSMWGRAEKRWWADWARVCTGLERDCEANLNQVVRERVMGSVVAGIQGVEAIAAQRTETVSALRQEISQLNKELTVLEQRLK